MFAIMPPTPPTPTPTFSFTSSSHSCHRPAISSPLSSSPFRASASSSPPAQQQQSPLSPCSDHRDHRNHREAGYHHQTQSSPIFPSMSSSSHGSSSKFRFAARDPRPNPAVRRREDVQETRRQLFLQNVRHRADEKRWERRGGEDEVLKLEWWRQSRERERQLARDQEACFLPVEVVAAEEEEEGQETRRDVDVDALMVDDIERQEEAEVQALVSALEGSAWSPSSSHFSDDDDYDGLFMDLISEQQWQQQEGQAPSYSQDVEMS